MTERKEAKGLQSLRQTLADDIMDASDKEILAQFAEDVGSPEFVNSWQLLLDLCLTTWISHGTMAEPV